MAMRVRPSLLPLSFRYPRREDMRKGRRQSRQKQRERHRQRADGGDDVCSKSRCGQNCLRETRGRRERTRQWWTRSTQEVRVAENAGYVKIGWLRGALRKSDFSSDRRLHVFILFAANGHANVSSAFPGRVSILNMHEAQNFF